MLSAIYYDLFKTVFRLALSLGLIGGAFYSYPQLQRKAGEMAEKGLIQLQPISKELFDENYLRALK